MKEVLMVEKRLLTSRINRLQIKTHGFTDLMLIQPRRSSALRTLSGSKNSGIIAVNCDD